MKITVYLKNEVTQAETANTIFADSKEEAVKEAISTYPGFAVVEVKKYVNGRPESI